MTAREESEDRRQQSSTSIRAGGKEVPGRFLVMPNQHCLRVLIKLEIAVTFDVVPFSIDPLTFKVVIKHIYYRYDMCKNGSVIKFNIPFFPEVVITPYKLGFFLLIYPIERWAELFYSQDTSTLS